MIAIFHGVPVYALSRALSFPSPDQAVEGLVAVGGDLSPKRLLLAYRSGIFPWYDEGLPILWHSPDPRCVMRIERLHVGRTLRRAMTKGVYDVRYDTAFGRVIRACKKSPRPGQHGTWITDEMEQAYLRLHALGYAHSVESWAGDELVGGLYGVSLGHVFFGESMFARQDNASKIALVTLAERIARWGFQLIDAQVPTPHTVAMGAEEWPRATFLRVLAEELDYPTRRGSWADEDPGVEG
jgi:leucyl/phenylalanyl-tRNA---protein transferase